MIWTFSEPDNARAAGMAVFSEDPPGWTRPPKPRYRYRLGRKLSTSPRVLEAPWYALPAEVKRVVFVMLNPSTADAFELDPTVTRCCKFAARWGGEVLEVVNLFAFRSPDPSVLRAQHPAERGADVLNTSIILDRCIGAHRVVAAWGSGGTLENRAQAVTEMLMVRGVPLLALARVPSDGSPMHPLARGKHRIPDDCEPQPWGPT